LVTQVNAALVVVTPLASVAEMVTPFVVALVGELFPVIIPVDALSERPLGSPDAVKVNGPTPFVTNALALTLTFVFTKLVCVGTVTDGAACTVQVKAALVVETAEASVTVILAWEYTAADPVRVPLTCPLAEIDMPGGPLTSA
jgi:hypothetical protein